MSNKEEITYLLLPHQDDEFGIFKVIDDLKKKNKRVIAIYLTTGTFTGEISHRRNQESLNVLSHFGIPQSDCIFLGGDTATADGQLYLNLTSTFTALTSFIDKTEGTISVYSPAWEGGHQDHDATYLLTVALCKRYKCTRTSFQFPLYNAHGVSKPFYRVLHTLHENGPVNHIYINWRSRVRYLGYCLSYPSQTKTWIGILPFVFLDYLINGSQKLQKINTNRINERPHNNALLYENRGHCSWENFTLEKAFFIKFLKSLPPN